MFTRGLHDKLFENPTIRQAQHFQSRNQTYLVLTTIYEPIILHYITIYVNKHFAQMQR